MIWLAYSWMSVGFRAISMSFFSFLSQKTYLGECFRPEVILSRRYLKNAVFDHPLSSSICHFLKMSWTLNHLQLEPNIFRIFVSLWYLLLIKISKKINEVWVTYPGWFNMELTNEAFFPFNNRCYDQYKNVFCSFS